MKYRVLEYGNNGYKTQGGGLVTPYEILSTEATLRYYMIEKNGFSIYMNCDAQSKEAYADYLKNAYKNPDQVSNILIMISNLRMICLR